MRLYIKQHVLSLRDRFTVKDENEIDRYFVEGDFMTFGKKLRVHDETNKEVLYIEQKLWKLLPEFDLFVQNEKVATVKKEWAFLQNNYSIDGMNWEIEGSVTAHDYVIKDQGRVIADINKKWISWGDTYEITIHEEDNLTILLGIVIVIDCVISASRANNA